MKKLLLFSIVLLLVSWKWRKSKQEIPPGTIQLRDNFFVDQTEIRNIDWREFCYWVTKFEGEDSLISVLPDTLTWRSLNPDYHAHVELYYRHPAYNNYPVIGISYAMANNFTKWRTHRVLEHMLIRDKSDVSVNLNAEKSFTPEKYFSGNWQNATIDTSYKFPVYRLPTRQEWLEFSKADTLNKYPFGFEIGKKISWKDRVDSTDFNCNRIEDSTWYFKMVKKFPDVRSLQFTPESANSVRSGLPNNHLIFNTIGNVSELTSTNGVAIGGNFNLYATTINLHDTIAYDLSECWLGFRCVAEFMNWREYQEYLEKN